MDLAEAGKTLEGVTMGQGKGHPGFGNLCPGRGVQRIEGKEIMKLGNKRLPVWAAGAAILLVLVAVACQPSGAIDGATLPPLVTASTAQETSTAEASATVMPAATSIGEPGASVTGEVPKDLLDAILEDAEARTGIAAGEMSIVRAEAVVWNDGSLGCPEPGVMYTQAEVPGYRIVLRAGNETLDYHAYESGSFILCPGGLAPVASPAALVVEEVTMPTSPTIPTPVSAGLQQLIAQAKEDLALRLSIPTTQIDLVELSAVVWPDGALGCPQPGVAYTQVQQEGLLIRLCAGKRIYPYHSGGGTAPFLCNQAITDDTP